MIPYRPSAAQYGMKRDRRKLHVELLHLPPEDSRASKYHPEAGNAPSQSTPTMKSSSMDSSIPSLQKPPSVVGRVENKSKLGSLCSPQISSRLDF